MTRKPHLILAFLFVFIVSCQKEPDESIILQPTTNCQLTKAVIYDETGDLLDTAGYIYTGSKVTKIEKVETYTTFEYSGDKVIRRNHVQRISPLFSTYDNITYNSDGTPAKMETFITASGLPAPFLVLSFEFVYNGGKLTGFLEKADTTYSGQPLVTFYSYEYTYTGDNITGAIETDLETGLKETLTYEYTSTANVFKPIANGLFTEVLFTDLNGQTIPFAVSTNNISSIKVGGDSFPIAYTLDTNKKLSELLIGGVVAARYSYTCK
jgi:hypothetical protein